MGFRRSPERPQARTDRWQREDDAPRLATEISQLSELKILIEEFRGDQPVPGARYTKPVIVERAPARFEVTCGEPKCQDGGHDITLEMMRGLREGAAEIEGRSECRGFVGDRPCDRAVKFKALATYAKPVK